VKVQQLFASLALGTLFLLVRPGVSLAQESPTDAATETATETATDGETSTTTDAATDEETETTTEVATDGETTALPTLEQPLTPVDDITPERLRDVHNPQQALRWIAANDHAGRRFAGLAQAGVGYFVATLGLVNILTPLDMGWGSPTRQNAYYAAMIALGTTAGTAGVLQRMNVTNYAHRRATEMLEEGATDAQILRYISDRAVSSRRTRLYSGLATFGFGVAAFLALEAVSEEPFAGESLRVSVFFGTVTTGSAILGRALRTPEERLERHLRNGGSASNLGSGARVSIGPGNLRLVF
jgi:hypothetical protein